MTPPAEAAPHLAAAAPQGDAAATASPGSAALLDAVRAAVAIPLPLPGAGRTRVRHRALLQLGRRSLSLARLAEAHFDAVAILAEAGRSAVPGVLYGVWAAELPGRSIQLLRSADGGGVLVGEKPFCSGAGLVDRALVTVGGSTPQLIDVDLSGNAGTLRIDLSSWQTAAFADTSTATVTFDNTPFAADATVGAPGWYLDRPGFWHGACGPASCWAGGAAALVDWAALQKRDDAHTAAHRAAMQANVWAMGALLDAAGDEIDAAPLDGAAAPVRALRLRHLVESLSSDVLHRFGRAYGPHPLAMNRDSANRHAELEIYLRQCHAERDLETLGRLSR